MKIDLKKELKALYTASTKEPVVVDVPTLRIIAVTGEGDPNTAAAYREAMQALYTTAYTLKFASKGEGFDFTVMPLEGQWWSEDLTDFLTGNKDRWLWRAFIVVPDFITEEAFEGAISQASKKEVPGLDRVRFESLHEGPSAQIMHLGSYSEEAPTIERLHTFLKERGHRFDGQVQKHHEIYLGDPRRTAPEKLKTIIRQPFH